MSDPNDTNSALVSIVIAVKNSERYLAEALDSIRAQTYPNYEVIVVDGKSSDRSVEIALSYPSVRVLEQAGQGFADAWNIGIADSRGDLIAILDSDDIWAPEKLRVQADLFERQPELDYVIGRMRYFLERDDYIPPGFKRELLETDHVAFFPSALLARRSLFEAIGNFDTSFPASSDIDWFARAKDHHARLGIVPQVLFYRRVHDSNLSYSATSTFDREIVRVLKQTVDRQRRKTTNED